MISVKFYLDIKDGQRTKWRKNGIAEFAGLEYAGLENDGQSRRGGMT